MTPPCECPEPTTTCPRYGVMEGRYHQICQGVNCTPEKREKFIRFWTENPQIDLQPTPRLAVPPSTKPHLKGTGTQLLLLLKEMSVTEYTGCSCAAKAALMNRWGPEECTNRREEIIGWIREEASKATWGAKLKIVGTLLKKKLLNPTSAFIPDPTDPVASIVDEAIRRSKEMGDEAIPNAELGDSQHMGTIIDVRKGIQWAYGITTILNRRSNLLVKTIESLRNAGFDHPRLFVDGNDDVTSWKHQFHGLPITVRGDPIRTHGNWILALYELYIRQPEVDRYALFQDDFVTYHNLRKYLEHSPYPEKGYLNLYTFPSNQELCPKLPDGKQQIGWYKSNQFGRGAVATIFDREALKALLTSEHMFLRPQDAHRGFRAVDGGIVTSLAKAGIEEYVHNPSLVQHTGDLSSMGNPPHLKAISFRGETYDALDLLEEIKAQEKVLQG